jgi:RNA polymerase sigma factor (sigma-70 family)
MGGNEYMTDAQLLERFVNTQDESAFAALVQRHGPMVLKVCRQLLYDGHEVEDALTFLVLVRKAASISNRELLANGLFGVAYRVAARARAQSRRRAVHERQVRNMTPGEASHADDEQDVLAAVHEELNRLPEKYRAPVVLCYFQGMSREEAARQLGATEGAVKGRLERARDLLRPRLASRGLALPSGMFGTLAFSSLSAAAVPVGLSEATVKGSLAFATGAGMTAKVLSETAIVLAEEVLSSMVVVKSIAVTTVLKVLCGLASVSVLIVLAFQALTTGSVSYDEAKTRHDLQLLCAAVQSFQTKYGVDYIPSRIVLARTIEEYRQDSGAESQLHLDSLTYLSRVWPRIDWSKGIDWSGGTEDFTSAILEGDQCLVFFLGGIPGTVNDKSECLGFSTDPRNPARAGADRCTFFYFSSHRLIRKHDNPFFSYLDGFGKTPFAYFSSYKTTNGYHRYQGSDCASLGVAPYAESWGANSQYLNPNTFQIISAGADGRFDQGTIDDSTVFKPGRTKFPANSPGYDDITIFADKPLGQVK